MKKRSSLLIVILFALCLLDNNHEKQEQTHLSYNTIVKVLIDIKARDGYFEFREDAQSQTLKEVLTTERNCIVDIAIGEEWGANYLAQDSSIVYRGMPQYTIDVFSFKISEKII